MIQRRSTRSAFSSRFFIIDSQVLFEIVLPNTEHRSLICSVSNTKEGSTYGRVSGSAEAVCYLITFCRSLFVEKCVIARR